MSLLETSSTSSEDGTTLLPTSTPSLNTVSYQIGIHIST